MLTLIIAGEAVFFLPFVLPRIFRPVMLEAFGITNTQLGWAFFAYGIVAMIAYLPGGPLADIFSPRRLMVIALVTTAAAGVIPWVFPDASVLIPVYAIWGLSTILLFWSALIRATRQWGEGVRPGTAFGLLDGGRGLVAALLASSSVWLYAWWMPSELESVTAAEKVIALQKIFAIFVTATLGAAILVHWTIPDLAAETDSRAETSRAADGSRTARNTLGRFGLGGAGAVISMPTVWLQAVIVICAYVGYKSLDDVSLYAKVVLGMDDVDAGWMATYSMWMRPPAAMVAGWLADRWRITESTTICFAVLAIGAGCLAGGMLSPSTVNLFVGLVLATSAATFALRGLYFAIMKEGRIPFRYTGTAVGIVSAIGYLPDVFMGPMMGYFLDGWPGARGHQYVFAMTAGFALVGLVASLVFRSVSKTGPTKSSNEKP